jgi:hypothetical protein
VWGDIGKQRAQTRNDLATTLTGKATLWTVLAKTKTRQKYEKRKNGNFLYYSGKE